MGGPRNRRWPVRAGALVAVVGLVAGSLGAVLLLDDGSDDDDVAEAATEDLSEEARDLVELLEAGRTTTYHVRYEGSSPDAPDTVIKLETWQRPPRVRQDSEVVAGGRIARTRSIVLPTGGVRCTSVASAPWTCREAAAGELRTDAVTADILQRLREGEVRSRFTTIDGRQVRCFTLTRAEGTTELCTNDDGVPIRVRAGASELQAVELSTDVGDDVFAPPAAVT